MVFGEIVEPSTRALIDDEFEEYPEYHKPHLNWQGDSGVPGDLRTLIFIEGSKIIKLFNAYVLEACKLHCCLINGGVQIFKIGSGKYVVSYTKKDLVTGEIIEELSNWLRKASSIYAITEESLSNYQNVDLVEKPETLIRKLCTENLKNASESQKLESPNLVSGLGADILSFSIHTGLKSTLFVVYMNSSPLDSINIHPVIELMKSLDLSIKSLTANLNPIPSNLYL